MMKEEKSRRQHHIIPQSLLTVLVGTSLLEGDGELLPRCIEVVLLADLLSVHTGGHGILIEHNVVGEASVVLLCVKTCVYEYVCMNMCVIITVILPK